MATSVNDVVSYIVSYNSTNVLPRGSLGSSVVDKVCFIGQKIKSNACRYFETMKESINPAFYAGVIIEYVAVEITELKDVLF